MSDNSRNPSIDISKLDKLPPNDKISIPTDPFKDFRASSKFVARRSRNWERARRDFVRNLNSVFGGKNRVGLYPDVILCKLELPQTNVEVPETGNSVLVVKSEMKEK